MFTFFPLSFFPLPLLKGYCWSVFFAHLLLISQSLLPYTGSQCCLLSYVSLLCLFISLSLSLSQTEPSHKPSGTDANFLQRIKIKMPLPANEIFAPRSV